MDSCGGICRSIMPAFTECKEQLPLSVEDLIKQRSSFVGRWDSWSFVGSNKERTWRNADCLPELRLQLLFLRRGLGDFVVLTFRSVRRLGWKLYSTAQDERDPKYAQYLISMPNGTVLLDGPQRSCKCSH